MGTPSTACRITVSTRALIEEGLTEGGNNDNSKTDTSTSQNRYIKTDREGSGRGVVRENHLRGLKLTVSGTDMAHIYSQNAFFLLADTVEVSARWAFIRIDDTYLNECGGFGVACGSNARGGADGESGGKNAGTLIIYFENIINY
jgi:hypothetical protein